MYWIFVAWMAGKKGAEKKGEAAVRWRVMIVKVFCVHMWTGCQRGTPQCVCVHVPD